MEFQWISAYFSSSSRIFILEHMRDQLAISINWHCETPTKQSLLDHLSCWLCGHVDILCLQLKRIYVCTKTSVGMCRKHCISSFLIKHTLPQLPHFRSMPAARFLISICVATERNMVQPALAHFLRSSIILGKRGAPPYRPVILCCFARLLLAEP